MKCSCILVLIAGIAALALTSDVATADVVVLTSSKDNTLYSSTTGGRSNGVGDYFFAGKTASNGTRRGLVAFDLGAIPADAIVTSATLRLYMSRTLVSTEPIFLHRVLADWGEGASNANAEEGRGAPSQPGDATWLHTFYSGSFWNTTGGDFVELASASTDVEAIAHYNWSSTQLTADVQAWISTPSTNFGWVVMGGEANSATAKRFGTRENPVADERPLLTIEYTVVPEPGVAASLTCLAAGKLLCRRRHARRRRG